VEENLHAFLAFYHMSQGCLLLDGSLFFLQTELLELLALEALHEAILIKLYQRKGNGIKKGY
jgi:hypothetical protein